ncbi:MAG: hypothetical protein F6K30_10965 [Cyanothece sp. SIO2G6]|nr:hypothetical protein [Cyanothece sp. SIO2G6]
MTSKKNLLLRLLRSLAAIGSRIMGWGINVLMAIALVIFSLMLLWYAFIGAVIGIIVAFLLDKSILLGLLGGGGLGGLIFLFGEDSLLSGGDGSISPGNDGNPHRMRQQSRTLNPSIKLGRQETGAQIQIQRSLSEVFGYVSNFSHYPDWQSGIEQIERLSDHAEGIGVRFRYQKSGVIGKMWPQVTTIEITQWQVYQKIAYCCHVQGRKDDSYIAGGYYLFEPVGTGAVVSHVVKIGCNGWGGLSKRDYREAIAQSLANLKQHLELDYHDSERS